MYCRLLHFCGVSFLIAKRLSRSDNSQKSVSSAGNIFQIFMDFFTKKTSFFRRVADNNIRNRIAIPMRRMGATEEGSFLYGY